MTWRDRSIQFADEAMWQTARRNWLGVSELAAVLGMSHIAGVSPFSVWAEKDGCAEQRTGDELKGLRRGNRAEAAILGEFADEHPEYVVQPHTLMVVQHPAYPLLRGTPDALLCDAADDMRIVAGADGKFLDRGTRSKFGEPGTDEMPDSYVVAGLGYCEVFEVNRWYFPCWFGRWEYAEFVVERNTAVAEALIVRALEWWHAHVETKIPPALDGSEGAEAFVKRLWPENRRRVLLPATPQLAAIAAMSTVAREAIAADEEQKRQADTQLRSAIGDADGIEGIATWKQNRPSSKTDWEAAYLDLAAQFIGVAAGKGYGTGAAQAVLADLHAKHTKTIPGPRVLRLTWRPEA